LERRPPQINAPVLIEALDKHCTKTDAANN